MSESDDKELLNYLHRKSALSMGYRKVYVEAPPAELDRAIKARARRALKVLGPAVLSMCIALGLVGGLAFGVNKFIGMAVQAERHNKALENPPVAVDLNIGVTTSADTKPTKDDAKSSAEKPTRQQWQKKIDALNAAGKKSEAEAEFRRFKEAYP